MPETTSEAPRILLIEDNFVRANEIRGVLQNSGCEVQMAANWPYALLLALNFAPELVLLETPLSGTANSSATQILQSAPQYISRFAKFCFCTFMCSSPLCIQVH